MSNLLDVRKENMEGVRRLSDDFYDKLRAIDRYCDAVLDPDYQDGNSPGGLSGLILPASCRQVGAIHVFRIIGSRKIHELTLARNSGECNAELERRTIARLHEIDVWKRHGDGLAFDDWLAEKAARIQKEAKEKARQERLSRLMNEEGDALREFSQNMKQVMGVGVKRELRQREYLEKKRREK